MNKIIIFIYNHLTYEPTSSKYSMIDIYYHCMLIYIIKVLIYICWLKGMSLINNLLVYHKYIKWSIRSVWRR